MPVVQMKFAWFKILLCYFLVIGKVSMMAQAPSIGQIQGKIIDARTSEPLPFTNVFVNNSTIGTTSNATGDFVLKKIPLGQQDIIFSFVGYQSYQARVFVRNTDSAPLLIKLTPSEQQLQEAEVVSARDKAWEKQLRKFEKIFIGDNQWAAGCKIKNPWVIEFTDDSKVLSAKAAQPLEIENTGLGYRIHYNLSEFKFFGNSFSIIGDMRFEEMSPRDAAQALQWTRNRELVYLSSARHLMKSIINQRIEGAGFRLYADKIENKVRTNNFSHELEYNLVPFDTAGIVSKGAGNEYRILFKSKAEVHNTNEIAKSSFYRDVSYGVSWVETTGGYVRVNKEGTILNPKEVIISGDMASGRIANLLPLDYTLGSLITIETHADLEAKRLQEKVYLQTDKPYYYSGEKIWFSAYVDYRSTGVMDTLSKVLYVDLMDSTRNAVKTFVAKIDSGRTKGNIKIPGALKSGNYVLRAYTQWMRNYGVDQFFIKPIPVLTANDRVDASAGILTVSDSVLKITHDSEIYHLREKVNVSFELKDEEGNPIGASISVSVTDTDQVVPVEEQTRITKDYLMKDDLPQGMLSKFIYPVERGITEQGTFLNKKGKPDKTRVTVLQDKMERIYQETTDAKGNFVLAQMDFYDSVKFGVQVENGTVTWKKREGPLLSPVTPRQLPIVHYNVPQRKISEFEADDDVILLKEVEVKSERINDEPVYENIFGKPDVYIKGEALTIYGASLAAAIVAKIPGFRLDFYQNHWFLIRSRGEFTRVKAPSEPVIFFDNIQVLTESGETGGDRLHHMNTAQVDHIEVSSMINSQLGANGASGAIYVYTKRVEPEIFKGLSVVKLKGYDTPSAFQSPDYANPATDANYFDARATLYWNPNIKLSNDTGKAQFSFFTSDMPRVYKVVAEGITVKGKPVRSETLIRVEE